MNYILKIKIKSKYLGFHKTEYIEFNSYEEIVFYLRKHKIKYDNYEIYGKIIL